MRRPSRTTNGGRIERPSATAVSYSRARDEVRLMLDSGTALVTPRRSIAELRALPRSHMRVLELMSGGQVLALDSDDVHIYVPGLVRDLTGWGTEAVHLKTRSRNGRGR
jgi:hypothetical protein